MKISRMIRTTVVTSLIFLLVTISLTNFPVTATGDVIRNGAWVDSITLSAGSGGPDQIKDGTIDIDTGLYPPGEFAGLQSDPSIDLSTANGLYYEYT